MDDVELGPVFVREKCRMDEIVGPGVTRSWVVQGRPAFQVLWRCTSRPYIERVTEPRELAADDSPRDPARRNLVTVACWLLALALFAWAIVVVPPWQTGHSFLAVAFAPWAALACVLATVAFVLLRRWLPIAVVALSALLLLWVWFPSFTDSIADANGPGLSIGSLNMRFGLADPQATIEWMLSSELQIVSLQEVTPDAWDGLMQAGGKSAYPFSVNLSEPYAAGTVLLSQYPILSSSDVSGTTFNNAIARVVTPDGVVAVVALHPAAPGPFRQERFNADWDLLMPVIAGIAGPVVLAGDFNATPNHKQLRELSGQGFTSAATESGAGFAFTWPTISKPGFPIARLDHIMYRGSNWEPTSFTVTDIPGSDHRAIATILNRT